eukprot:TRINITY_DN15707_c1_g1_i2.p3 TRINITY_DN15707_c1_g1~~TRINITY_DN15707_c1_g1_i2.p3  ORF type:complete len:153 (-),score=19.67 TRINITY_DN15707_c1_g1_i2:931-1389(-)
MDPLNDTVYNYTYANRRCNYRDEMLEISPAEKLKIDTLLREAVGKSGFVPALETRLKILAAEQRPCLLVIDTDIGTDVDDALALLMALHMPPEDVRIIAVTTNYYPTRLRKLVADSLFAAHCTEMGRAIPVVAGNSRLCGTHRLYFHQVLYS